MKLKAEKKKQNKKQKTKNKLDKQWNEGLEKILDLWVKMKWRNTFIRWSVWEIFVLWSFNWN